MSYAVNFNKNKSLKKIVKYVFIDQSVIDIRSLVNNFSHNIIAKHTHKALIKRILWHKQCGHRLILVTRALDAVITPWAREIGFDDIFCVNLGVKSNGKYSGEIVDNHFFSSDKYKILQHEIGEFSQYEIYAYGNCHDDSYLSHADKPFLIKNGKIKSLLNKKGTALITGGSSGIGLALAKVFYNNGHDIILVAREIKKLNLIKSMLYKHDGPNITIISSDLTNPHAADHICEQLQHLGLNVDVLINNAGIGRWGAFTDLSVEGDMNLLELLIGNQIKLTKKLVPSMLANCSGLIVMVSSVYAVTPIPYQALYSASKQFIYSFANALAYELKDYGIHVCTLCPGSTSTDFLTRAGIKPAHGPISGLDPDQVASLTYKKAMCFKSLVVPGLGNKFYFYLCRYLPAKTLNWLIYKVRGLDIQKARNEND